MALFGSGGLYRDGRCRQRRSLSKAPCLQRRGKFVIAGIQRIIYADIARELAVLSVVMINAIELVRAMEVYTS